MVCLALELIGLWVLGFHVAFIETYGFEGKTVIFFATSGGSTIDKANKDFAAAYPKINWKAGKTLNGASKADIKVWVEGLK